MEEREDEVDDIFVVRDGTPRVFNYQLQVVREWEFNNTAGSVILTHTSASNLKMVRG